MKKISFKSKTVFHLCCLVLAVIVVYMFLKLGITIHNKKKEYLIIQTTLDKTLNINELQTVEYVYNSYAIAYGSNHSIQEYDIYKPVSKAVRESREFIEKISTEIHNKKIEEFQKDSETASMKNFTFTVDDAKNVSFNELRKSIEAYKSFIEREKSFNEEYADILNQGIGTKAINTVIGVKDIFTKVSKDKQKERQQSFEEEKSRIEKEKQSDIYKPFLSMNDTTLINNFIKLYNSCDGNYKNFYEWDDFLGQSRSKAESDAKNERYAVGINEKINFEIDTNKKIVTVKIPPVKILDAIVDIPSDLENKSVITRDKKYTSGVSWMKEAYSLCRADLLYKAENNTSLMPIANENAINAIKAFVQPFLKDIDYDLEVVEVENEN